MAFVFTGWPANQLASKCLSGAIWRCLWPTSLLACLRHGTCRGRLTLRSCRACRLPSVGHICRGTSVRAHLLHAVRGSKRRFPQAHASRSLQSDTPQPREFVVRANLRNQSYSWPPEEREDALLTGILFVCAWATEPMWHAARCACVHGCLRARRYWKGEVRCQY